MSYLKRTLFAAAAGLMPLLIIPSPAFGYSYGPEPYVTGDPQKPDNGATCSQSGCHTGTNVNAGGGSVKINAGGSTYTPGQTVTVSVTVADPTEAAWGFQLTARVLSTNVQAGSFTPGADGFTWVECADGSTAPCKASFNTQFIEHTMPKTGAGSGTFTFTWTAPSTNAGTVVFYAAGNAANGNAGTQPLGDHIYTTSLQLTPAASQGSTTTTLTSSVNPSVTGQSVSLTASVSPSAATGTVTFSDGSTSLGAAALSGGKATLAVASLAQGTHSITAAYSGDASNGPSASAALTQTVGAAANAPSIGAVVPVWSSAPGISSDSLVSIYGTNLASATESWDSLIVNGQFPTNVAGTSVSIGGKPAYVAFVSPLQLNVQAPDFGTQTGTMAVTVTSGSLTSAAFSTTNAAYSPSFLLRNDGKHVTGVIPTPDGSGYYDANGNPAAPGKGVYDFVGPGGPNGAHSTALGFDTRAAKPGEVVELFGTGFGPTNPSAPAGQALTATEVGTNPVVTIGGIQAVVQFAGMQYAGEYQINVQIPANAPAGDLSLVATAGGVSTSIQPAVVSVQ